MTQIKVGDIVEHVDIVQKDLVVMAIANEGCVLYSKEMSALFAGHDGISQSFDYKGNGDIYGHYLALLKYVSLKEVSKTLDEFQIGDTVLYVNEEFTIVGDGKDGDYILFSEAWVKEGKGHDGVAYRYKGNGHSYGHYLVNKESLKLVKSITQQHEIFGQNQEGCPRGIQSTICGQPLKLASSVRFVGSTAANIGIELRVATGTLNNSKIQLDNRR